MNIYFRLRGNANTSKTIYCRISVNRSSCGDFSTGIRVNKQEWDHHQQKIVGDMLKNDLLQDVKDKIIKTYKVLDERKIQKITGEQLKQAYINGEANPITVLDAYDSLLNFKKTKKLSDRTLEIYTGKKKLMLKYLDSIEEEDFFLNQINFDFGNKYYKYFVDNGYSHNYIMKQIQFLKEVCTYAQNALHRISFDPLFGFPIYFEYSDYPVYLSDNELKKLEKYEFASPVLKKTKDFFLAQCYSGLSYIDLKLLNWEKDVRELTDYKIIEKKRHKSKHTFVLPVFSGFERILHKYNYQLPLYSNQRYNIYLKEIAAILDINKRLTTHVGRKTAGMYWLNNGISYEVVSRMLGHSSIITTQKLYAKVLPRRVIKETLHLMD